MVGFRYRARLGNQSRDKMRVAGAKQGVGTQGTRAQGLARRWDHKVAKSNTKLPCEFHEKQG